jgi:RHS repeat-associated protein
MVQYDPSTITSPPGNYSGVNLSYVLTPGQVTTPGLIVRLPRVDNAETVMIGQNSSSDQTFYFKSIPNLVITVYAGTTFSLADGTQPNPFPLRVVEIPYEQVPDYMPPDPTQVPVYAMSIEPFNSSSSQPIAVSYPNRSNTPPGTDMPLTSLNPTLGMMVPYGTGMVSADGTRIVPDLDPKHPGHLYGISNFDWFFFLPNVPNAVNPSPDPNGPNAGEPVDLASGLQVLTNTDIAFGGARGQVAITRTFRGISVNQGPFGIGTNYNYGYLLDTSGVAASGFVVGQPATGVINLIMPDGNQFPFVAQPNGTYINTTIPTMSGAVISNLSPVSYSTYKGTGYNATLRWKNGTVYQFQPLYNGQAQTALLTSITDANGNAISLIHSSVIPTEIVQVIDPVGRSLNLNYDDFFRVTSVTDPIGRSVQYTYNSQGTLATVTDVNGGVTSYAYDGNNNLLSITDPRGITYLQNTYDSNGRVVKQVAADGGVTTFSYTMLNPVAVCSSNQYASLSIADAPGGQQGGGYQSPCAANVNTSPIAYTTVTDPIGNATTYHFDPQGFLLDTTDALGQKTVYTRAAGTEQLLSVTDPLGRVTSYSYDASGNTTSVTNLSGTPNAATTFLTYDPVFNHVITLTDPLGNKTSFTYDQAGNRIGFADPLNDQMAFTYDGNGEMLSSVNPLGNITQFAYSNGDVVSITDPIGRTVTRVPDAVGRTVAVTDQVGDTTQYQYDPLNHVTRIIDPLGNQASFMYDGDGNLTSVTDARQNTTSYAYDWMNQLLTRTDPIGRVQSYQYDQAGNLILLTDARGIATIYSYDVLNRVSHVSFGGQNAITYSYDAGSRVIQVVDSITGQIRRGYDGMDRLLIEETPQGSVSYAYDLSGRRTVMQVTGQQPVNYSYDLDNQLTQITQAGSSVAITYDAVGRRTSLMLPNGVSANYSYDAASQLATINYEAGGNVLGTSTYAYDATGHRTSYGGSFGQTGIPSAVATTNYDSSNELMQLGPASLSYDANGNLIADGVNTYSWDARNHLVSISGGVSASFQYDPFGRRVTKTVGNKTTNYLYDVLNPVQELSGGTPEANVLTGQEIDEYYTRTDGAGTSNFLTDGLGNTIALSGASGGLLTQYTYEPFGNETGAGASSTNAYQYISRENDGTGLYYFRARYYDPKVGRFISQDPAEFLGGINLYAYVSNSPVNIVDRLGTHGIILPNGGILDYFMPDLPPPPPLNMPPLSPPLLYTDYDTSTQANAVQPNTVNGTTTFYPGGNEPPLSIQTLTQASQDYYQGTGVYNGSPHPHAGDPYCSTVVGVLDTGNDPSYGGNFIKMGPESTGRGIHGGGKGLAKPLAPDQPLIPTHGCTRGHNQDVKRLADAIKAYQKQYPNMPISYCRK